jgi:uncharacterized protein
MFIVYCLLIGAVTGIISALCGVGGGIVMVPAFRKLLDLSQKDAIATSLLAMIVTAAVASTQNIKNGLGDWRIAAYTALGSALTSYFAAGWLTRLKDERLTQIFGLLLLIMGARMLISGKA